VNAKRAFLPPCVGACKRPLYYKTWPEHERPEGGAIYGANGMCAACYRRTVRHDAATPPPVIEAPGTELAALTYDEQQQAVCAQADPEAWFPDQGSSTRDAKRICRSCPLTRVEDGGNGRCLEVALANNERYGVWGGLSERQRRALRREQVAA